MRCRRCLFLLPLFCVLFTILACGPASWKWSHELDFPLTPGLVLSASMDGDTFVPYEPIYATVSITNVSNRRIPIPKLLYWKPDRVYDLSVVSPVLGTLPAGLGRMCAFGMRPRLRYDTLIPGESLSDVHYLDDFAGIPDTVQRGVRRFFPPGDYRLRVTWDLRVFPEAWAGDVDTAAYAHFVVREPSPREERAMALYLSLRRIGTEGEWGYFDSCGSAILRDYPDVKPCAPLTLRHLILVLHRRWTRLSSIGSESATTWADSASSLWFALMDGYPDSRTAAHVLRAYRFLAAWADENVRIAVLHRLADRFPGTRVAAESKRQLALLRE